MDAFSYLSVLISIIIGLAITQILQGYRGLLLARAQVRFFWPSLAWSALVLFIATQSWWASFGLSRHRDWTFLAFAAVLLQSTVLYLLAGLALPDIPRDAPTDLQGHYERERRPFYWLLLALLGASLTKDWIIDRLPPRPLNLAFHLGFASLAIVSLLTRARWWHRLCAPFALVLMLVYVAALFTALPGQ